MAKQDETFEYSNFSVGSTYTKLESMKIGGVEIPKQARDITGITRFKNCVVLFVTLDKQNKEAAHKYHDVFLLDGKQFHWESQNSNTPSTPHMQNIFNGYPVVLFARVKDKIKSKTQPFAYIGLLKYLEHRSSNPVEVLYDVVNYQEEATPILTSIYLWESTEEETEAAPELLTKVRKSGQGRMVDAKKKKAIELHAMEMARDHYESTGYTVVDTSSNKPYDFECFKGDLFRRIEVKGTMSKGDSVYVTSGEVIDAHSEECETDLFIVSNIRIKMPVKGEYETSGGDVNVTKNWKPAAEHLEAKTYKYHVPG